MSRTRYRWATLAAAGLLALAVGACKHSEYLYRHQVEGRVQDAAGAPVEGARVIRADSPQANEVAGVADLYERTTGADGTFRFVYSGLGGEPGARDTWHLVATHPDHRRGTASVEVPLVGERGYVAEGVVIVLERTAPPATIGTATMEADGTLVLDLRAQTGDTVGHAQLRYPPDHARYRAILEHVGPLEPGQSRPVRPFPD